MTSDARVVLKLSREPRLMPAIFGAVQFQALQLGLDPDRCETFAKACQEICLQTIVHGANEADHATEFLEVTLDKFPDRVEFVITGPAASAPVIGLDSFLGAPGVNAGQMRNGAHWLHAVDRILYGTVEGVGRTTLVKFLHPPKS